VKEMRDKMAIETNKAIVHYTDVIDREQNVIDNGENVIDAVIDNQLLVELINDE
jgi:hypothetical protein